MVALGVSDADGWPEEERDAFRSLCPLLAQVPDLPRWPPPARRRMVAAMRAKGRSDGMRYFELTRTHERFGQAMAGLSADTRSELESGQ